MSHEFSGFDPEDEEEIELRAEEKQLLELEGKISRLKGPQKRGNALYAKGVAMVLSFGLVMAGCLMAGLFLGDYLAGVTGIPVFKLLGIVLGLVVALSAAWKLMQPFLKSDD